jgi:hypothetical protein
MLEKVCTAWELTTTYVVIFRKYRMFFYSHEATYDILLGLGNTPPDGYTMTSLSTREPMQRLDQIGHGESHPLIILDLGSLCTPPFVPEI